MQWHLYGRVVDNFGDVGVAWRLAADLAGRGEQVRLALDDASTLAWMAPGGAAGVEVAGWDDPAASAADVVVELFGGGLPAAARDAIARSSRPPVCIDVEHLSAESYVERSHALPSPRPTADGRMLTTWFFFPGFTERTGGLLRERDQDVASPSLRDEGSRWLASAGIEVGDDERRVSLFCYRNEGVEALLDALADEPTVLLVTPGFAFEQTKALLGPTMRRGRLRALPLPFLPQTGYDHLLAACDLNFVRGEDSLVRAIWAGAPFVWQLYRQDDGAHAAKLAAFLDRHLDATAPALAPKIRAAFSAWNEGETAAAWAELLAPATMRDWRAHCAGRRAALAAQPDLTTQLIEFAAARR